MLIRYLTQIKPDNNISRDVGWNKEQVKEYLAKLDVIKSERPDEICPMVLLYLAGAIFK